MLSEVEVLTRTREDTLDAKTVLGEVETEACPYCGSQRVRWRKRRFYDVVFTWLAAGMLSCGAYSQYDDTFWAPPREYNEAILNEALWITPRRFWKCRDCERRGEEY